MLPTDIAYEKTPARRLKEPLNIHPPEHDAEIEQFVLDEIIKLVEQADNDVIILVDACAIRHGVRKEVEELIKKTGFPVYSAPMGKTAVDEQYERYGGVSTNVMICVVVLADDGRFKIYVGSISHPEIMEKVESANLILSIGALKSDFNTGNFTYHIPAQRTIEVSPTCLFSGPFG